MGEKIQLNEPPPDTNQHEHNVRLDERLETKQQSSQIIKTDSTLTFIVFFFFTLILWKICKSCRNKSHFKLSSDIIILSGTHGDYKQTQELPSKTSSVSLATQPRLLIKKDIEKKYL